MNKITIEQAKQAANECIEIKRLLEGGWTKSGFYTYQKANGDFSHAKIRLNQPAGSNEKKWIRPISFNGKEWVIKEPDFEDGKPLYLLPSIVNNLDATVYVVEGEKCVDALAKLGLIATTSGAADSANKANWSYLAGRAIIIWRDFDLAGLHYAQEVTRRLLAIECSVTWVDVEKLNLPAKGDCVDWLEANPTATKANIEALPLIEPKIEPGECSDDNIWDDPILFDEIDTPEIPSSLLPSELGVFAAALSLTSETPESLSVMVILGVVASIVSRLYVVSPKDGWQESTNIYSIIGLPPANNKTLVLKTCTAPLSTWEKEQKIILEPQIKKQRSELKSREKIIEALRAKAAKEEKYLDQESLILEIAEKEALLVEPQPLPCLFVNDITPEELTTKVHEQKNYLGIFSDEGGIIEVLSGLYTGGSANIDILLKGIDGGDVKVRRKDKNFDLNPLLSIVLTVQPPVIQKMGAKKAYSGNGYFERFLYLLPKSKLGYRTHNTPPISKELVKNYNKLIENLLESTLEKCKQLKQKIVLTLANEASADWKKFQQSIERELRPNGTLYVLRGWAGKICGFALRIAGILHVIKKSDHINIISKETMDSALEIAALLIQHAIAAYDLMGADQSLEDAREVFNWIMSKSYSSFSQTEITRAMRHRKMGKKERLAPALAELIERNILKEQVDYSTQKPTTNFLIHPKLRNEV